MNSVSKRLFNSRGYSQRRVLTIATLAIVLVALPLTVAVSQKQQETRQHASCNQKFLDVECDNPYYVSTAVLASCGILEGDIFRPYNYLTKAEAISILTRYHADIKNDWQLANPLSSSFDDVLTSDIYFKEIETAKAYGFFNADGNFKPADEWLYGFKGINNSDYSFNKPQTHLARAYFAQQLYNYAIRNDLEKINSCSLIRITPTIFTTPAHSL